MYPGNELLLPAYLDGPREMKDYVRKPLLGREGANVQVIRQGEKEQSYGRYGEEGWVYQALAPIPCMDGHYPVLGSWMIAEDVYKRQYTRWSWRARTLCAGAIT